MGRRKERRLAAMGATGRRVKLDLFAEPTGDSGGSSAQEEVGGDGDSKSHAEFPDSPSSSGQQPQNPLLLLGQYSDEELDNDAEEVHHDAMTEQASLGMEEQSKAAAARKAGPSETNNGTGSVEEVEELLMNKTSPTSQYLSEKPQKESIMDIDSNDLQNQTDKSKKSMNSTAVDKHLVGDVISGWKMVLHEESNQYYYWNVTTGETSWEVPAVLAQHMVDTSGEKDIRDSAGISDAVKGTYQPSTPLGMVENDLTASVHPEVNSETSHGIDSGTKKDGSNDGCGSNVVKFKENGNANRDKGTFLLDGHSIESNSATDLSTLQLIQYCESLLDRLNSMKCLDCYLEGQDLKSKFILEIEIRLADIKALSSYQSSLLPFWLHSEAQLKRLEATLDCAVQQVNPASLGGFEDAHEQQHECTGDDSRLGSSETKAPFATAESHVGDNKKKSMSEAPNDGATTMEHDLGEKSETIISGKESELNYTPHSVEDVDMDVDMEVEDTSSIRSPHVGGLGAQYHVSVEPLEVQSMRSYEEPTVPGHVSVPTDEAWIPPPPPDDESFPPLPPDDEPFQPPPPDEPQERSYPPTSFSSAQAIPYSGEYALSYPGPGLEYYVQTNPEISGSTLYTPSEGGEVALSHVTHYYEAGPNIYPVAPAVVNPVETTSYYGLQNGTVGPVFMHSTAVSSGAKTQPASNDTGALRSLDSNPEAGSSLLLKNNISVDKSFNSFHSTEISPPEVLEARRSPATSSMANGAPVASTSDTSASTSSSAASAAAAAAAAAMKPKVSRMKKRTLAVGSTLRSNKKVSSMVDKWKAAKEELHEDDEEPEDAYEVLEKKRQREIEQWRANQIASGEAKDNANFQPLGGDWRERVKRKRAQKKKESSPEVSSAADKNQQPDLIGLSKGLPSGWQAYWDDSSKQVYYGHVLTSVTSWVRPTE